MSNKAVDLIPATMLLGIAIIVFGLMLAFTLPDIITKGHDTFVYIGNCK